MRFVLALLVASTALAQDGGRRTISDVSLLLFTSPDCGSCKRFESQKVLETVRTRVPRLRVETLEIEFRPDAVARYGVEVTPTLILIDQAGFPLGRPRISLDDPAGTTDRIEKLVRKMTGG